MDIADWLRGLGLEQYESVFRANKIGENVLSSLTAEDLKDLGVASVGDRRRLLGAIAVLRSRREGEVTVLSVSSTAPHGLAATSDAERRQITVMFCDLVGSTALAARLDPEDLREIIGAYHRCCTDVVRRHNGIVSRYMGDGVLAYFGYPRAHEDDAEQAVRAGLSLLEVIGGLQTGIDTRLQIRVGIATGTVVVGDLGEAQERSVVGQTPNLAARLQGLAEPNTVVIAADTRHLVGGLFEYHDLGMVAVKGLDQVQAWRVLSVSGAESRFDAQHERVLTPLVGRDEELGFLLHRWSRATEGDGSAVLLSGEPGIGKSRIWRALRERLAGERYICLRHYCSPHHQNSALYPIISKIEREAGFARVDTVDQKVRKLEQLLADSARDSAEIALILDLLSLPTGERYRVPELSPKRRKELTMGVLLANLEGSWARHPLLVIFEDVHWIDPTSLKLLGMLIESVSRQRVLLLITARPEFHAPWRAHANFFAISLNRLGSSKALEVAEQVSGAKKLPPEVLKEILARTDGVPLFIEELTKAVIESVVLREQGGKYERIPATLHDSLMARLDRLEETAEVARIGSVIGREFSYELLFAIAGLPQGKLDAALTRLIQSELVFSLGETQHSLYSFKHALVRDAAYSTLLRNRRRQLHARIASVLEAQFADTVEARPELLAHHCAEAGLIEKAVALCLKAGRQAIARSAMTEAIAHLQKGLELVSTLTLDAARLTHELDLQIALGHAVIAAKGYGAPDTGEAYARARELCEELNGPPQLVPVLWGQWVLHLIRAEFEQANLHAGEMLRLGRTRNDVTLKYLGCRCSGLNCYYFGDFTAARSYLEECLALYDPMHSPFYTALAGEDVHVGTLMHLSRTLGRLGYLDQARVLRDDALTKARRLPPFTLVLILVLVWFADWGIRSTEALLQLADEIMAISAEQGFRLWLAAGSMFRGWCIAARGDKTAGIAQLIDGLAAVRATGCNATMPFSLVLLADAYGKAGRPRDGLNRLNEAAQVIADTHERWEEAELHRVRGELLMIAHQERAAEESFRKAIDIARRQKAKAWELRATVNLAQIRCHQGRRVEARDLMEPIYGWFTEGLDTPDLKAAKAILDAVL